MSKVSINIRVKPAQKSLLTKASAIQHKDQSAFILDVACREAEKIILDHALSQLNEDDSVLFDTDGRIVLKTTKALKDMLNTAASLTGQDMTSFVLASAEERAKAVLNEYQSLFLSRNEQVNFMHALKNPGKPNQNLRNLMSEESFVER